MKTFSLTGFAARLRKLPPSELIYLCGLMEQSAFLYKDPGFAAEKPGAGFVVFLRGEEENFAYVSTSDQELLSLIPRSAEKRTVFRVRQQFCGAERFLSENFGATVCHDTFDPMGIAAENFGVFVYPGKEAPSVRIPDGVKITENAVIPEDMPELKEISEQASCLFLFKNGRLAAWLAYSLKDINALGLIHLLTLPEYRKQGLAGVLLSEFIRRSLAEGCIPLYGSAVNEASAKTAASAGFINVATEFSLFSTDSPIK